MALVSLAAVALTTESHAQTRERLVRVGFSGGAAVPLGDIADYANAGASVQGFLQIAPSDFPASFRVGALYSRFGGKDGARLTLPPTVPGSGAVAPQALVDGTQILGGLAQVRVEFAKQRSVRPYLIGGAGAFNVRQTFAQLQSGNSVDKVRFGVDGGAGVTFNFAGADAFLEARVNNLFGADGVARELSSLRVVPISFGVVF
jgi:opacity protein-like surface antigen